MCAARILFKLSGSIAAWKACAVISRLVREGHEVRALATESALRFIGPATLEGLTGQPVRSDMWEPGTAMEHINLVKWADMVVLCPATANTINHLAAGLADDLLGALFLARDPRKPYLVAPAMNPAMWVHPATQAGVETLRRWGVTILPVASGRMACGDEGEGRLIEPEAILAAINAALGSGAAAPQAGGRRVRVLVTAGGTEEPVDGVRTLSNFSTGRTGVLLAEQLRAHGCEVTLLRAERAVAPGPGIQCEIFRSFADLSRALQRKLGSEDYDAVVQAAAVSDFSVAALQVDGREISPGRGKVGAARDFSIRLAPNPKLIDVLRTWSRNPRVRVVGFKLTRGADAAAARSAVEALFAHSKADAVIHNDLESIDRQSGRFPGTLWRADGSSEALASREEVAHAVARFILEGAAAS